MCETEGRLLPAADVSRLLEGGSYPTSNLVMPSMYFLIETSDPANSVMLPSNGGTPVKHEELHLAVQEARELFHDDQTRRWVEELAVDVERFYIICSGCDPRFKSFTNEHFPCITSAKHDQYIQWLRSEFEMIWAPKPPQDSPPEVQSQAAEAQPQKHKNPGIGSRRVVSLAGIFASQQQHQDGPATPTPSSKKFNPMAEMEDYLSLPYEGIDCDALDWWASREARFPNLCRMVRQYLGCPASSASVERLFSAVERDFSKLRKHMKAGTLENHM